MVFGRLACDYGRKLRRSHRVYGSVWGARISSQTARSIPSETEVPTHFIVHCNIIVVRQLGSRQRHHGMTRKGQPRCAASPIRSPA